MAGRAAVRPRGSRPDPGQAAARRGVHARRPLIRGLAAATLLQLSILALGAMLLSGCAHGGARPDADPGGGAVPDGVRLLFDARVTEAHGEVTRFRLAVAFRPPDHLRLEALGPAGGTRLVIATDGAEAVAILVSDRRYDRAPATADGMVRWTGLPIGASDLGALLQGKPPCGTTVPDRAAGGACDLRCALEPGESFARSIAASGGRRLELTRVGDPAPARLDDRLFAPEIPAGFEPADLATLSGSRAPILGRPGPGPGGEPGP